ncbi:Phosphoribosylamine--glycine ligase [Alteripontixanthobacter maritimus]|uniref:Phosphoribosylamine--glycine ligase n=1 Tax=Alteripontixanthobacter maritimus TaxID=2161824 RepID=A0A369QCA4_9SPHN|nr:Phosphoribosylamine--glycine ligase [Alteripontixanthobacter maritimus]
MSHAPGKSDDTLYAAPGNPGIADHAQLVTLDAADHSAVLAFCEDHVIGLVVVGPEQPLVAGLADDLRKSGVAVFGPSKAAAQLEGSKAFTKQLCERAGIPTAAYREVETVADGKAALDEMGAAPYVLKADGLAAGKGVVIAETRAEADAALADMLGGQFGSAGARVVIEAFMAGEEASFFALTDGTTVIPFGTAQDHKRVGDGDTGPNTGGMGAYSPAPVLTGALQAEVMQRIVQPTVDALRAEGTPYSGVLYAGLMLTADGPQLIEYNCRFGDPECQVLMMRLESDLGEAMLACANGMLAEFGEARFAEDFALTVVMAAKGYPGTPEKGGAIVLGPFADGAAETGAKVFHAGTTMDGAALRASGGRVLNVTATGATATEAQSAAYAEVQSIDFPTGFYRTDIGGREVTREVSSRRV